MAFCRKHERYIYGIVAGVLFGALVVNMSFNSYGASISGDEYFSIGFANNTEDFLFLTPGVIQEYSEEGNWIKGDFLHEWLSVQEDERFEIMSIHRNVRNDVHPPLYFMLLNWISSFFVDEVTLFPGYLINVISGAVICILMYLIMRKIFLDKWIALIPPLFWTTSAAGSITMTYLRMYAPLCALTLLCLYLHILYMEQKKERFGVLFWLTACTLVGTLTHYYYYVMQFIFFVVIVITLLYYKQFKKLFCYGMSLLIGEIISVAAYPYVFRHLLYSERGVQVQENLVNNDWNYYKNFFLEYMNTIDLYVFFNRFGTILIALVICTLVAGAVNAVVKCGYLNKLSFIESTKRRNALVDKNGLYNLVVILIAIVGYFLILFKISYSSRWLYISPIFSLLGIITIGLFTIVFSKMHLKNYGIILLVISCLFLCPKIKDTIEWAIEENANTRKMHEEIVAYSDHCDVLFIYNEWNNLYDNQILELMEFDQIYTMVSDEIETVDYNKILSDRKDSDDLIIYISTKTEEYRVKMDYIIEEIGSQNHEIIREDGHLIYFVEL